MLLKDQTQYNHDLYLILLTKPTISSRYLIAELFLAGMQKAAGHDEHEYIKQKIHVDKSKWEKKSTVILTTFYVNERMKMQSAGPISFCRSVLCG